MNLSMFYIFMLEAGRQLLWSYFSVTGVGHYAQKQLTEGFIQAYRSRGIRVRCGNKQQVWYHGEGESLPLQMHLQKPQRQLEGVRPLTSKSAPRDRLLQQSKALPPKPPEQYYQDSTFFLIKCVPSLCLHSSLVSQQLTPEPTREVFCA